jgi:hypothetical protein
MSNLLQFQLRIAELASTQRRGLFSGVRIGRSLPFVCPA